MSGKLIRLPTRAISGVLVFKDRAGEWIALAGANAWSFGSVSEARREAAWLARNTGLPVRESIGGRQ